MFRGIYICEPYRLIGKIRTVKELVDKGMIGKVEYVINECHIPEFPQASWMDSYTDPCIEDLGYHHFACLHYLFGISTRSLCAISYKASWSKHSSNTSAAIIAETMEGYHLNWSTYWAAGGKTTEYIGDLLIEGTKGSVLVNKEGVHYTPRNGSKIKIDELPNLYTDNWGPVAHVLKWLYQEYRCPGPNTYERPFTIESFGPVIRFIYTALESAHSSLPKHCSI